MPTMHEQLKDKDCQAKAIVRRYSIRRREVAANKFGRCKPVLRNAAPMYHASDTYLE
jgi:hypothetical protein